MDNVEGVSIRLRSAFGAATLLAASCAVHPTPTNLACQETPAAVARAAEYLIERDNQRDLEGVLAGYSDDVLWLPPSGEAVAGKALIEDRYRRLFSTHQPHLESEILESHVENGLGYVRGLTRGVLEPLDGSPAISVDDKFLAIVRCEHGDWRVSRLAWSRRSEPSRPLNRPRED